MNRSYVGDGKVILIAGGGRIYSDVAARFVRSERMLEEIIATPYSKKLVRKIVDSSHKSVLEFDYFLFGVEGYARVTEVQLVRKRIASYMIKTGRVDKRGKRSFDIVVPQEIEDVKHSCEMPVSRLKLVDGTPLGTLLPEECGSIYVEVDSELILRMIEGWYEQGIESGVSEENLRYLKPQATEFKALIGMNAHALIDWFTIRCCRNAQTGIRDMANKMLRICRETAPDLFDAAGPNCRVLGYCPENESQNDRCKGRIPTKNEALKYLRSWGKET